MIGTMDSSPTIGDLAAAIAQAQAACDAVYRDRSADLGRAGSYRYATLGAVLSAIVPAYSAAGVAIVQGVEVGEGCVRVTTMLAHSSGQWISSTITMPCGGARPQEVGSAITYARRYAIQALAGVAAEDDDDGAAAHAATPARRESPHREQFSALVRQCQHAIAETTDGEVPTFEALCSTAQIQWPPKRDAVTDQHYVHGIARLLALRDRLAPPEDGPPE